MRIMPTLFLMAASGAGKNFSCVLEQTSLPLLRLATEKTEASSVG
jgi:hypothetical protein